MNHPGLLLSAVLAGLLSSGCTQQIASQNLPTVQQKPVKLVSPPMPELKSVPMPVSAPAPSVPVRKVPKPQQPKLKHTHAKIPGCTKRVTHIHPYRSNQHKHALGCVKRPLAPRVTPKPQASALPKIKAKGHYKGAVQVDRDALKAYQR